MIKIENTEVFGWEAAIRGMRSPKNSWEKSDSWWSSEYENGGDEPLYIVGENDFDLMKTLANAGADHGKFLRMIHVQCDITAPDYWFKEFSTYRVGVTENSTSTMHKIHYKEFTLDDFSHEHLGYIDQNILDCVIENLNLNRRLYIDTNNKQYWWQMIQLLPMSYNYRRTVDLNYAVLRNMYHARKNHKLDCWIDFCEWIESLPYAELITGEAHEP